MTIYYNEVRDMPESVPASDRAIIAEACHQRFEEINPNRAVSREGKYILSEIERLRYYHDKCREDAREDVERDFDYDY